MDTSNSFFDARTAAVFGNGGGVQVQDTLNQANIPQTEQFKIVSDLNVLNAWQGLALFDDFQNTTYQTEKPVYNPVPSATVNSGQSQMKFDFNLMGYTDVSQIFLEYDLVIQGQNIAPSNRNIEQFQGQLCLLDNIRRVKIEFGNNNFVFTVSEMEYIDGIKTQALDGSKTIVEKDIQAFLGLSKAKTSLLQDGGTNYQGTLVTSYDQYSDVFQSEMAYLTVATTAAYKKCAIPLSMLNSFFKREGVFLPPGLNIKITIDYILSLTAFYELKSVNYIQTVGISPVRQNFYAFDATLNATSNPSIVYQYNLLKETSNEKFISMWGDRPLLYNYFDYGKSVYQMRGDQFVDNIFLINRSCPLEFLIRVSYTTDKNLNGFYNLAAPQSLGRINNAIYARLNEPAPFIMSNLKVFANGVLIKEVPGMQQLRGVQPNYGGKTGEEIIGTINAENQQYETAKQVYNIDTRLDNRLNSCFYKVILAPGDIYNINKLPIDMGTTQLRIQCYVSDPYGNAFDENFQLQIYYKNLAQLLINNRYTCVSVKWPAISNGSYNFITPTFAAN